CRRRRTEGPRAPRPSFSERRRTGEQAAAREHERRDLGPFMSEPADLLHRVRPLIASGFFPSCDTACWLLPWTLEVTYSTGGLRWRSSPDNLGSSSQVSAGSPQRSPMIQPRLSGSSGSALPRLHPGPA